MAEIGKRIRERRESIGMSQEELAKRVGYRNKSTIAKIEAGVNDIVQSKVVEFAEALRTSVAFLMGWEEDKQNQKTKGVTINVIGRVAAGIPIEAIEDIIDAEEISEEMAKTGTYFGLQIHGKSMEPRMYEGDVVIVRKQEDASTGDVVIVTVNGTDATCKRLKKYRDGIELISINPSFESKFFTNEEIEKIPVRVIGKVVELRAKSI